MMAIKILAATAAEADRMTIQEALHEYCPILVSSAQEAFRALEEQDGVNLLLLDLDLPGDKGFPLLEFLAGNKKLRRMRPIIITGPDAADKESKGLALGAVDCIHKPLRREALKARIDLHAALLQAQQALAKQEENKEKLTFEILFEQAPSALPFLITLFPSTLERLW